MTALPVEESRKVVTIVFADLVGSTPLHERLDAESVRRVMDRYYAALRSVIEGERGTVVKLLGDGVLAAFGVPQVREDDALRAVRAASAMQRAVEAVVATLPGLADEFGLRVGVNTGEVVVSGGHDDIVGDPVNIASRLQDHATIGDVLIGDQTARLVQGLVTLAPAGELALKGRTERVTAHRLVSLDKPGGNPPTRLVGRDDELERLLAAFDGVAESSSTQVALVLGSPGLGKTRLLTELASLVPDRAVVLSGRCDAAGTATFAPLAEALRDVGAIDDDAPADVLRAAVAALLAPDEADAERIVDHIVAMLGSETGSSPEETFWAMRRLLAGLARRRPVLLVLDDLHWAEPLLLDFVEHLVEWSHDVPMLVVGAARPEIRDTRAALVASDGIATDVIVLDGLDASAATKLASDVLGTSELPAAIGGRLLAASEGNPLFLRELVRMLVDDHVLVQEGTRWTATVELAELDMPPTIHALLAARIERLRPEQRAVIERAAVIGKQFTRAALGFLLPRESRADLDAHLEALRRTELVEPDGTWFLGDQVLRFHHALIRDAAYRRLLKETRAQLHERYADWLRTRAGDSVADYDEALGWHLEQAHVHLIELGELDEHARSLGDRSAQHLADAGRRALDRDDLAAAAGLLGRAIDRLEPSDPDRAELLLDRCEALLASGEVGEAQAAVALLHDLAADSGRLRAWHVAFASQLAVLTEPERLPELVKAIADAAQAMKRAGDVTGEAKARYVQAQALGRLGRVGAAESALDDALAAARSVGHRRLSNAVLSGAPHAALWGPSPVTRASGRCLDVVRVLRITAGAPAVEAVALRCQAVLEALRGRVDAARRMIGSARRTLEDLGLAHRLLETEVFAGRIELIDGDAAAAETYLRHAYGELRQRRLGGEAAIAGALLARALLLQGRDEEAEEVGHEAELLAGAEFQAAIAWRGARAEVAAHRGDTLTALRLARQAVEIASTTDALLDHADARLALSAVLRASGDASASAAEAQHAAELYEAKGASILAERARASGASVPMLARQPTSTDAERPVARRVRANLASSSQERLVAALAADDSSAVADLITPHAAYSRRELAFDGAEYAAMLAERSRRGADIALEVIATLGDTLSLARATERLAPEELVADWGESLLEGFRVNEVDDRGRAVHIEHVEQLGSAIVRLYELYAEQPDGLHDRAHAAAVARSVGIVLGPPNVDAFRDSLTPDAATISHRRFGSASRLGRESVLDSLRSTMAIADDILLRVDDVFALTPDLLLYRWVLTGTSHETGVPVELAWLQLAVFGPDGLITRFESFDDDAVEQALTRVDELTAPLRRATFENAAARVIREWAAAWSARDWDAAMRCYSPSWRVVHQGRLSPHRGLTTQQSLEFLRLSFEDAGPIDVDVIATRGDRLVMVTLRPLDRHGRANRDMSMLHVIRAGDDGLADLSVRFEDPDDLDAGYAELDRLFAEGEGSAHTGILTTLHTFADAVAGWREREHILADEFVVHDRRASPLVGTLTREEYLASRNVVDIVDQRVRLEHLPRVSATACVTAWTWAGTADDHGSFEIPRLMVFTHDGQKLRSLEMFDPDAIDDALARYDELTAAPAAFENAATRNRDRFHEAWAAREWDAVVDLYSPEWEIDDRRSMGAGVLSPDESLASLRFMFRSVGAHWVDELLATRGDRLALYGGSFHAGNEDTGVLESDGLFITRVDADGRRNLTTGFDLDDIDAAYAELDRLYVGSEGGPHTDILATLHTFTQAVRDGWGGREHILADDFVVRDRRAATMLGDLTRAEFLATRTIAHDIIDRGVMRLEHLPRLSGTAGVAAVSWSGAGTELGRFELQRLMVFTHDGARVRSFEIFDPDAVDAALARYDELTGSPSFENAAVRASRRFQSLWAAGDRVELAAMYSPALRHHDRRGIGAGDVSGDVAIASLLGSPAGGWRVVIENVATRGERLALNRLRWTVGSGPSDESVVEFLCIDEFDDDDRLVTEVIFDLDALEAAYEELDERYATGEAAPFAITDAFVNAAARSEQQYVEAWNRHDWDVVEANIGALDDRRALVRTNLDRDAAVLTMRTVFEEAPSQWMVEPIATRGDRLALCREGLAADAQDPLGVGDVEVEWLVLGELDATGRRVATVVFDPDDLDAAYEELDDRYATGEAAPHARTWARERERRRSHRERELHPDHFAPSFRLEDHRPLGWGTLDRQQWVDHTATLVELSPDVRSACSHVPGLHERAVFRVLTTTGQREGGPFEIVQADVIELDGAGRPLRWDVYDLDQLDDARARYQELTSRRRIEDVFATVATRSIDASECVELVATRGDRLALYRSSMTTSEASAGAVEHDQLVVCEVDRAGLRTASVVFDVDDLDGAYDELDERMCAIAPRRAAAVARGRTHSRAIAELDWHGFEEIYAPDLVVDDHRPARFGTLRSRRAFVDLMRSLGEISTGLRHRIRHVRVGDTSLLLVAALTGTSEAGPFDNPTITVQQTDDQGRTMYMDMYDVDQLDEALARFHEVETPRRWAANHASPPAIAPNAASRASARVAERTRQGSWDAARELFADTFRMENRCRLNLTGGDLDHFIRENDVLQATSDDLVFEPTLVATLGDRLALEHHRFTGLGLERSEYEEECLFLVETNSDGKLAGFVAFEVDDERAAHREMHERFLAGEGASELPVEQVPGGAVRGEEVEERPRRERLGDEHTGT